MYLVTMQAHVYIYIKEKKTKNTYKLYIYK